MEVSNIRETLKYSELMLSELRAENMSPKDYYSLFTTVFDELTWF